MHLFDIGGIFWADDIVGEGEGGLKTESEQETEDELFKCGITFANMFKDGEEDTGELLLKSLLSSSFN